MKECVSTRGGLADGTDEKNVILVTAMSCWEPSHSNNELREVSRGHSTSKKMREGLNNRKSEEGS